MDEVAPTQLLFLISRFVKIETKMAGVRLWKKLQMDEA